MPEKLAYNAKETASALGISLPQCQVMNSRIRKILS